MQIHSLRLENIKSYSSATFHFTPGVNAIVGHNGAGKSTIVEAIGFALFDAGKGSALQRQGTSGGQVVVGIESTLDERRYEIVRRTKESWYVHDAELGARIVGGADDVKAFLREHMGLARGADLPRIFDDAVGVAQGALTAAFLRTPAARKPIFDPLLGVDEYERAFATLLDTKNLIRDKKGDVETLLARAEGVLEQLPAVVASLLAAADGVKLGEETLAQVEVRLAQAQQERAAWDGRRTILLNAQQRAAEASAAHERAVLLQQNAECALAEAEAATQIVAANQAGHDAHLAQRARRTTLEAQVEEGRKGQVKRAQLAAQADQHRQSAARAEAELARIAEVEATVPALQQASERERALQQQLDAARSRALQRDQLKEKQSQLEASLHAERKRLDELRAQAESAEKLRAELSEATKDESALAKAIEAIIGSMSANQARGEGIKEQNGALEVADGALCPVCEQPLTPEHRTSLHSRNEVRLAELRATWSSQKAEKSRLEGERGALAARSATISAQLANLPNAAQLEQAGRWCAELVRQLDECGAALQQPAESGEDLARLEAELRALGEPRVALSVATRTIASRVEEERVQRESALALRQIEQELAVLDEGLESIDTLLAELDATRRAEAESQLAWQQVIGATGAAAQRETRLAEVAKYESATSDAQTLLNRALEAQTNAAADYDEAEAEAARQREAVAQVEAGTLRNTLAMQRAEVERLTRQQDSLRNQEREASILKAQVDQIRRQQEVIDMMRATLKQAGPLVTRAMITRVSAYAAQWFGELTGDFSRRLIWDEEYAILLEQSGRKLEFKSISGGEQMAAALSVRLALLRDLGAIDVAFFDEPTAHLDAERREALAEQIKSVRGFRQLFVISHDDTFENKTDNVIKVEKSGGASRIVSE